MLIIGIYRLMIFSAKETGICLNASEILTILGLLQDHKVCIKPHIPFFVGDLKNVQE